MRDTYGAATMQHGEEAGTTVPEHVVRMVYGRFGFSAEHTAVLGYTSPYVLLATPRRDDPYSIVDTRSGRTVERWSDPAAATNRLGELAGQGPGRSVR